MSYVSGFVAAVPESRKADYKTHAESFWTMFKEHGAREMRECWADNVPDGEVTSFPMAVKAEPGEVVVFSWIVWPDRASADACFEAMMVASEKDPQAFEMPFDGKRMIWGGFETLVHRTA